MDCGVKGGGGEVQLVGPPCGQHGPYTFFKAFRYTTKTGCQRTVKLSEFFFVKLWSDSDLVCIGELQLLWVDKNSDQVLSSLRLYFLPENIPEGRTDHGEKLTDEVMGNFENQRVQQRYNEKALEKVERIKGVRRSSQDEVLAISEKVVLRLEDLITWITVDAEWTWGRLAKCDQSAETKKFPIAEMTTKPYVEDGLVDGVPDVAKIEKEKMANDEKIDNAKPSVVILSYPSYCRYRAVMKRLEGVEDEYLKHTIVKLLGGFAVPNSNTRILFCRDTFDYPELEGHELLCNHLAPKLKGRPRGRRKKRSLSPGSESNESESSISNVFNSSKTKLINEGGTNGLRGECGISTRRSTRSTIGSNNESKEFMIKLTSFMKSNHTPIGRPPSIGYKELDLHSFFTKVDKLGGYDAVTSNRLWKSIFEDLSVNYIITSAATVVRRHYEKFLLPYERHLKGEEYKPTSSIKRVKCISGSGSDADTSESTSTSGKNSPIPQLVPIDATIDPSTQTDKSSCRLSTSSESSDKIKPEPKPSSLRSVRLKSERSKEASLATKDKAFEVAVPVEGAQSYNTENNNKLVTDPVAVPRTEINGDTQPIKSEEIKREDGMSSCHQTSSVPKMVTDEDEVKENIATCNTNNNNNIVNYKTSEDLTEVPYKPKLVMSEASENNNNNNVNVINVDMNSSSYHSSVLNSVKRRKLDILKEGGLEVTPVKPCQTEITEERPTVIQHHQPSANISTTVGQISITMKQENVPQTNGDVRHVHPTSPFKPHTPVKNAYAYLNGQSLPIQSKSIYSYSEKTVYGNPKDDFMPPPCPPIHVPKIVDLTKSGGGEILDLTIKSPSKPINDVLRVPTGAASRPVALRDSYRREFGAHRRDFKSPVVSSSLPPILDGRVSSNLQITLVDSHGRPTSNGSGGHKISQRHSLPYLSPNGPVSSYTVGSNSYSSIGKGVLQPPLPPPTKKPPPISSFSSGKKENGRVPSTSSSSYTNYLHSPASLPPHSQPYLHSPYQQETSRTQFKQHQQPVQHYQPPPQPSPQHQQSIPHAKPPERPKSSSAGGLKQHPVPSPNATTTPHPPLSVAVLPPPPPPDYYSQYSMASKMMNSYGHPPPPPHVDPMYYSAFHNLYPHAAPPSAIAQNPYFAVPTPEQLQFYSELMAASQLRFQPFPPYPSPHHDHPGMTALSNGKPNETATYKKQ